MSHFADKTLGLGVDTAADNAATITAGVHSADVSIRQKVITQQWCVCQSLDDTVHETRVAEVDQTSQTCRRQHQQNITQIENLNSLNNIMFELIQFIIYTHFKNSICHQHC